MSSTPGPRPQELPASAQMMQMLTAKWLSAAISTAAELGIADLLASGDKTAAELAAASSAHAPSLYRLLRTLASTGVFAETEPRTFTLTPLAQCLRSDAPDSMRSFAQFMAMPLCQGAWGELLHCVTTGETGIRKAFGQANPFEYLQTRPKEAAVFDAAMTDLTRMGAPAVAEAYDFGRFRKLVDIAGGQGLLLQTILRQYPNVKGVLFDLPQVIERAKPVVAARGLADRCELIAGDFFQSVPGGADGYMMQHIIHDWDDERSVEILGKVRQVIDPLGRLLLMESVVPPGNTPSPAKLLDLEMLVMPGGRERTAEEYQELLAASGFRLLQVHVTGGPGHVIEAAPVL